MRYLMWKRKKKKKDIDAIVRFVHDKGGIKYARNIMQDYAARAQEQLSKLPKSKDQEHFSDLINFIINRKK